MVGRSTGSLGIIQAVAHISNSNHITDEEAFEASFRVFRNAVEALSKNPSEACEQYGHYNVAWEIRDDITAGLYLFDDPGCELSAEQRAAISGLVEQLSQIPDSVVAFTDIRSESLARMQHPSWAAARAEAAGVLRLFESAGSRGNG